MRPQTAFDTYAARYDSEFTHSNIGSIQREQVWRRLIPVLDGSLDILELNCGTGEDALRLARSGKRVLATDLSAAMLAAARQKTAAYPGLQLSFRQMGFHQLDALAGRPFDLIFSNFGGLNCLSPEETRALAGRLHALLRPGGRLFLVYMSRKCLWEQLYHLLKGLPEKARRRLRPGSVAAKLVEETVEVWYYDPRELAGLFYPQFRQTSLYPIGLFTPPSYLEDFFKRRRRSLGVLAALDRLVPFPALANYADHFAIAFRKI